MSETVRSALALFHANNQLDSSEKTRPIWLATLGSLIIPLPNFRWRREAIDIHDAHHLITGHTTSVEGELCLASWELGVRCYAHWGAKTLCTFLMVIGLALSPIKVLNAYKQGRRDRTRYLSMQSDIFNMDLLLAQSLFHLDMRT